MKKIIKRILISIIILSVGLLLIIFTHNTDLFGVITEADEASGSQTQTGGGTVGQTKDNFTILEIVPYRGLAEIGYLVGGQEPIKEQYLPSNYLTTAGELSFLGGAITVYRSYVESAFPTSGTLDSGWQIARTPVIQNGYFVTVGSSTADKYGMATNQESFVRVADGTGSYKAVLSGEMEKVYSIDQFSQINQKNVKAYFVYGKPAGTALYKESIAYKVYSVSKNSTNTGDYDYNCGTSTFHVNKGKGAYDVMFEKNTSGSNLYYMTADYTIVDDNSGVYSWNLAYEPQAGGNYNKVKGTTFTYSPYNGSYRWVQDESALTKPNNYYDSGDGKIWVKGQKVQKKYQFRDQSTFVNNEWLKRFSLGVSAEQVKNYQVKVITLTPEELNQTENQHYITEADMFYINAKDHNSMYISLYENYNEEGRSLTDSVKKSKAKPDNLNFAVHDLNWTCTEMIFKRAAGIVGGKAAVVIDNTYYQDAVSGSGLYNNYQKSVSVSYSWNGNGATINNMAKLYIMLYQRDMTDFYNAFMNPLTTNYRITEVASSSNVAGTTGSFIRPDSSSPSNPRADEAIYWNGNTFVPYGLNTNGQLIKFAQADLNLLIPNFNITATTTDVISNVLVIGGQPIFTNVFTNAMYMSASQLEEAIIHLASLGPTGKVITASQISIADIINVITNNGMGYGNTGGGPGTDGDNGENGENGTSGSNLRTYTSVLNIQPTADFTTSEAKIRTLLKGYTVQIVNMTSVQFNSSMEDINTHYDMIYIGCGNGRFNLDNGSTAFNNTALNGYSYISPGDNITTSVGEKYAGNDITEQKKSELEYFVKAGYPIVLEDKLYQLATAKAVLSGTNLYTFISQNLTKSNLINLADLEMNTTNAEIRLKASLNVIRPIIKLISPTVSATATRDYEYVDATTGKLVIEFALLPWGSVPSTNTYHARLYLDYNGNGIFSSTEELTIIPNSAGETWENIKENQFVKYALKYDMSNLNGIYQWKVIIEKNDPVTKADTTEIRSEITGYAAHTKKQDLYVLQIIKDASSYNLENKVSDQASRIYEYTIKNELKDYTIHFDTLTVAEFEHQYETVPYTTATANVSNQLNRYHILILDNQGTPISNSNGAVTNIKDEIANNLGVVFTKGSLNYDNQSKYLSSDKFSFLANDTYNQLNLRATSTTQKRIFNSLDMNGALNLIATYATTSLTKTNEGTITQYPYKIGSAIRIVGNSYSEDTTIDLKHLRAEPLPQPLIGWYSLSDSKSPGVRAAGLVTDGTQADSNTYKGIYSSSPNDIKNNYYLFSKGNLYYSGIDLVKTETQANNNDDYDDEMKLFVNTIIAAHRASNRTISIAPKISIESPKPVVDTELNQSITINPADLVGKTEFVLTFKIIESSSNMALDISWLSNISNDWNKKIYSVNTSNVVSTIPISINNVDKNIDNGTYAIKIPIANLSGTNTLSIKANNITNNSTSNSVKLIYAQNPVVTIIDPVPIPNGAAQYLYVDIDYSSIDAEENHLIDSDNYRLKFQIANSISDVKIAITSDEISLQDESGIHVSIYPITGANVDTTNNITDTNNVPNGFYALDIPMSLMKDMNKKNITIKTTDQYGNVGNTTVTLLRRSLFPLD